MPDLPFGSGPGAQAPDGCSVEVYRAMPYSGELDPILPLIERGASVLELGCGAGRLTRVLLEHGCRPTVVDNSPEMLAAVPCAVPKVLSPIEVLAIDSRFDVVLLASHLINAPDPSTRAELLTAGARHLARDGLFYIQRQDPRFLRNVTTGHSGRVGDVQITVDAVEHIGPRTKMTVRYTQSSREWRHAFDVATLDDQQILDLVSATGLRFVDWIGDDRLWFSVAR